MGQLTEPAWIQHWAQRPREHVLDAVTTYAAIDSVRAGATLAETQDLTGLDRPALFRLVSSVGARCTQIAKHHAKATSIVAGPPGAPAHVKYLPDGDAVVTAADGWVRSRREGDIRKAYAAILLAEAPVCDTAITRVTAAALDAVPVRYVHFADLHAAARGVLPPLHQVVVDGPASDAYLRAWDLIGGTLDTAAGAARVLTGAPTPHAVVSAVKAAFWLVPQAATLHRWATLCIDAPDAVTREVAETRLRGQLAMVRAFSQRTPHRLAPNRLEQISVTQMRAVAALHGHHPSDGLSARTETTFESFATMARAALRNLEPVPA